MKSCILFCFLLNRILNVWKLWELISLAISKSHYTLINSLSSTNHDSTICKNLINIKMCFKSESFSCHVIPLLHHICQWALPINLHPLPHSVRSYMIWHSTHLLLSPVIPLSSLLNALYPHRLSLCSSNILGLSLFQSLCSNPSLCLESLSPTLSWQSLILHHWLKCSLLERCTATSPFTFPLKILFYFSFYHYLKLSMFIHLTYPPKSIISSKEGNFFFFTVVP